MVLLTVRSLGSFLRTLSYSAMAFCSLPCWTNFSAALRAFCLLKPKPNAIKCADSRLFPVERPRFPLVMPNGFEPRRAIPGAYRKGVYVRFSQTPEVRFQNGSQEAGTQMPRRRPVADGSRAQTAV